MGHSVGVEEIAHECIFPRITELHCVPFEISHVCLDYLRLFDFLPLPRLICNSTCFQCVTRLGWTSPRVSLILMVFAIVLTP